MRFFKITVASLSVIIIIIGIFIFDSCSNDNPIVPVTNTNVDPSKPDDLSKVLVIPNSQVVQGNPPPTSANNAPALANFQSTATTTNNNTLYLPFTYISQSGGLKGIYIQVQGAISYRNITSQNPLDTGQAILPITIPSNVLNGRFSVQYCIFDSLNRVSNVITTSITIDSAHTICPATVTGSDGLTISTFDLGPTAGTVNISYDTYTVPDRIDAYYNNLWVGGTGVDPGTNPPPCDCNQVPICAGYVGQQGTISFPYNPATSRKVNLYVSGCLNGGTAWTFTVNCPH